MQDSFLVPETEQECLFGARRTSAGPCRYLIAPAGLRAALNRQDDRRQDDRPRENEQQKRYYDRDHKDYHNWDDREASAYRTWQQERNENSEFSKLKRKEWSEYWKWRHEHPSCGYTPAACISSCNLRSNQSLWPEASIADSREVARTGTVFSFRFSITRRAICRSSIVMLHRLVN